MVDRLTSERRSWLMSRVRGKNTTPEMRVRKAAHALGFRFRLHRKDLSGCPDLVFPKLKTVVFVHGCFWHRHPGCRKASIPKSRPEYWDAKFAANVQRDARNQSELERLGWSIAVIWECETKDEAALRSRLLRILAPVA
ncbi:DNA mismatch endonuclease Vsr [Sinorhizobium meliloti]|nr:DNA mismatch endonuclease Vsr [Sinorhizobium meliloti]